MTTTPKPTTYKGTQFRSRLEARWAVFFDCLAIDWIYEPMTFTIQPTKWEYTPDFEITCKKGKPILVEVKPAQATGQTLEILAAVSDIKKYMTILAVGDFYKKQLNIQIISEPLHKESPINFFQRLHPTPRNTIQVAIETAAGYRFDIAENARK